MAEGGDSDSRNSRTCPMFPGLCAHRPEPDLNCLHSQAGLGLVPPWGGITEQFPGVITTDLSVKLYINGTCLSFQRHHHPREEGGKVGGSGQCPPLTEQPGRTGHGHAVVWQLWSQQRQRRSAKSSGKVVLKQ